MTDHREQISITDLRLQNFRSYKDASFELEPGVNIIVGPNASGKTNLIEALLVLSRGNSYRTDDIGLLAFGADWARLDADLPNSKRFVKLKRETDTKAQKSFGVDGQELARVSPARTLPVVLFEPNHLYLLGGSPDLRRAFLDDLLEQTVPGFAATRRHYRRVLAQRNALLKRNPRDIREQLFVWNIRLSELGGQIVRQRGRLMARFGERATDLYGQLAGKAYSVLVGYQSQFDAEQYESMLLKKLEVSLGQELLRGFTAYGPHRDDLLVAIDGHPVREAASRGEARTLMLVLKILELQLVEEARDQQPLILLDDVFSELDQKRRRALTSFLADYQTFITTTDADMVVQHFTTSNVIPVSV